MTYDRIEKRLEFRNKGKTWSHHDQNWPDEVYFVFCFNRICDAKIQLIPSLVKKSKKEEIAENEEIDSTKKLPAKTKKTTYN